MTRSQVTDAVGESPVDFVRVGSDSGQEYPTAGVFVHYDEAGGVEFIESYSTAEASTPTFQETRLISRPVRDVLEDIGRLGIRPDMDDGASKVFLEAGLAVYASTELVESASVFRRGYYDEE